MEGITRDMLPEAHRRLAEVIGLEATLQLCEAYGGAPLYIPKLDALVAAQRARRIRSEYDGMPAEWTPPTSRDYATDADLTPTRIAYRRAASAPLSASSTTCGLVADLWCFGGEKILPVVSTAAASKMLVPSGTFFTAQKIG